MSGISGEFGKYVRWIGWSILGFAGFALAAIILNFATGGEPELGALIVPAILGLIGAGICVAARRIESGTGPELPLVGSWAFKGFGLACLIGGAYLTYSDPGGIVLMLFGAVFVGAGHMMKRLFATPEGKKRVIIPDTGFVSRNALGQQVQHTSGHVIYVDEDADADTVDAEVRKWRQERLSSRSDWASKRIEGESSRNFGWRKYGPILTAVVATLTAVFAWFEEELIFWVIAGVFGLVTAGGTIALMRDSMRLKKFGKSHLILEVSPAVIGETLTATVETGIALDNRPSNPFRVTLDCDLRWEETTGSGEDRETVYRSRRLWRDKKTARPVIDATRRKMSVPVSFKIPDDAKPSSLGSVNTGVRWALRVEAELDGIDFDETFTIPIVAPDMLSTSL